MKDDIFSNRHNNDDIIATQLFIVFRPPRKSYLRTPQTGPRECTSSVASFASFSQCAVVACARRR